MRFIPLIAAFSILATPAISASTQYLCDIQKKQSFNSNEPTGFLPKQILLRVDPAASKVWALDPIVQHMHKAPIPASITSERNGVYSLGWKVKDVPVVQTSRHDGMAPQNGKSKDAKSLIRTTAEFDMKAQAIEVKYSVGSGVVRGKGSCKVHR